MIVISILEQPATANQSDPKTLNTFLDAFTKAGAGFADEVRRRTG